MEQRQIDASQIENKFLHWLNEISKDITNGIYQDSETSESDGIAACLEEIREDPTIDPENLRPTREQVEKVWRGEWIGSADGYADGELVYDIWECSECGYVIDEEDDPDMLPQFCPKCYAAMTDKAVDIVMKRLEALHENDR